MPHLDGPPLARSLSALLRNQLDHTLSYRGSRAWRAAMIGRGMPAAVADLLVARDQSGQAGENEVLRDTVQRLKGTPPRTVPDFLHEHRAEFLPATQPSSPTA